VRSLEISLENRDKIIAMLDMGICPVCGKANLKLPLQHLRIGHQICAAELRCALVIPNRHTFASQDFSEKISESNIRRNDIDKLNANLPPLNERIKLVIAATKKFKNTPESKQRYGDLARQGQDAAKKSVIRIDKENKSVTFDSTVSAAKSTGLHPTSVYRALTGKYKTAGGYRWKYAVEGVDAICWNRIKAHY